jgi:histidyl-tRNA synthetase
MIPDAELLSLLSTILTRLDVGEFTIKVYPQKISVVQIVHHRIRSIIGKFLTASSKSVAFLLRKYAVYPLLSINLTKWAPYLISACASHRFPIQLPWDKVKEEMTEEKGLDPSIADKIGDYVKHKGVFHWLSGRTIHEIVVGGPELLSQLESDPLLTSHKQARRKVYPICPSSSGFSGLTASSTKFLSISPSHEVWTTILA